MRLHCSALSAVVVGVIGADLAHGEYVVDVRSAGATSVMVAPGQVIPIETFLDSSAGDRHTSSIVRLVMSSPGLGLESVAWSAPYVTGGILDDSLPAASDLPMVLDDLSLAGPGYAAGVVDIELANVVGSGDFGSGVLVSMTLTIPQGSSGTFLIWAEPDTIARGFNVVPAATGSALTITVVPSVGWPIMALAAVPVARRRRGTQAKSR